MKNGGATSEMIGNKQRQYRYRWKCPLCGHGSKRLMESRSLCERYGRLHCKKQHDGIDIHPQILEIKVKDKPLNPKNKMVIPLPDDDSVWIEVDELPSFSVKSEDKLILPGHCFVRRNVYKKIQKQEVKNEGNRI